MGGMMRGTNPTSDWMPLMAETAEKAAVDQVHDQVRGVLETANGPLTTGEVATAAGQSSNTETRRVLEAMGARSRTLSTPGVGRKPEAWALDGTTLAKTHAAENGSNPTPRTARKTVAPGKARKVAAASKKRTSTAKKSTTRKATTARAPRAPRATAGGYEETPYSSPDGAPIVAKDGQLFVVRPLVEQG